MTRDQLHEGLVRLCQEFGFTTEHTYDLIDQVIDSIREDPDDDEPMDMSGSTRDVER